jgi:hypothetical protein
MNSPTAERQPAIALAAEQVAMIEEALAGVGEYGEVHLVVHKGRLRYLVMQRSYDALRWEPTVVGKAVGPAP